MKTVLIVGGGPAGLVAAKTLLRWTGTPFKVTLFEAAERVGGMWRAKKGEKGDKCSPEMRTNLSRFTVAFQDLPWQQVPLEGEDEYSTTTLPPMYPKAHQVGAYLEEYARKFLPGGTVFLNRRVTSAKRGGSPPRWIVSSKDNTSGSEQCDVFDYMIVASGFFDRPDRTVGDNAAQAGLLASVQHSADFRHVSSFGDQAGSIVVVGGGISGSEAAATAASQISNAKYAPGKQKPTWADSKIYHVFDRPFYVLPRYLPHSPYDASADRFNQAPDFLPGDLVLYNLSRRGEGDISAFNGSVSVERAPKTHQFLRSLLGGDYSDLGHEALVYNQEQTKYPGFTGIADTYAEFVRSGLIVPIRGRGTRCVNENGKTSVDITQSGVWSSQFPVAQQKSSIADVTGIIEATGYQVHLDYLVDDVKEALRYDSAANRVPFLLGKGSIFSPNIPELGFVGFYEGPFWAVMEMQARTIAQAWSGESEIGEQNTQLAATVREGIKSRDLSIPQFWMADYVGLVEEFSRNAGCRRNDGCFAGQTGPLFPARYIGKDTNRNAAEQTVREVRDLLDASENEAKFVAAAAFRAMQGKWDLHRKIISRNSAAPGGILEGVAHFHPREPTASQFSAEYLYIEEGTFTMDNGYAFTAKRRYIYRYSEIKDAITAWFVQEDGETVEKFFNELVFERPTSEAQGWITKGKHWCEPDMYKSSCEFRFRGCGLEKLGITYEVRGPNKDYTHESWYQRPKTSGPT